LGKRFDKHRAKHANPEADDAIPEAVGKELLETILKHPF
jgi:hypothetical protein